MVSCIVLAGGAASHAKNGKAQGLTVDGDSKAFLILGDRPLVSYVLDTVRKFFDQVTIVVKTPRQKTEMESVVKGLGMPNSRVVADNSKVSSPMAGISAGLRAVDGDNVFVVGCDMPFVNGVTIFRLMNRVRKDVDCIVPSCAGKHEPLCAIYSRSVLVDAGPNDGLQDIIDRSRKILVPVFDKQVFFNVNSKEDLAHAEKILKSMRQAASEK